ncbi:conserved hypothetical protein [Xanthomonas phaseoli pv. phaseoli]|uniref:Protein involved in meta-pathway of phenol degradation n=1 Tax=Xanthomonas campestris pv. phaseoli TaxID=317013 RepID=A0AB38E2H8_XANCH|nr:conserved hypothetical protein [Xanthomonas phaseoli pv. phaseoli]SON86693.1 conserved hypothetical protein [Xanthomonas phaseoli pv. phaseoli]SON90874.1 conserved hypothetical protein [Xanthomonas phaseoli pv. phaseoli]SOO28347.1 conserved hypothetical protein [Xanthomonas phaseoli pv. phaseoli]
MLPTPSWEVSARINYIYNFRSERRPNLPPGFDFRDGQAGDAGWINFATSWDVAPKLRLGINAYYLTQFRDNRTNDQRVPDSRQRAFYAGPGGVWAFDAKNILFANVYLPVEVRNAASGNNVNFEYVHVF